MCQLIRKSDFYFTTSKVAFTEHSEGDTIDKCLKYPIIKYPHAKVDDIHKKQLLQNDDKLTMSHDNKSSYQEKPDTGISTNMQFSRYNKWY